MVLQFYIEPEYDYQSWIRAESWLGAESNSWKRWALQDPDDAVSRGFGKLPYRKLKGIRIEIEAPCREDPGQIVCLWKKGLDLIRLFEQAENGLPNLGIHLIDSASTKWSVECEPQKSVAVNRERSNPPRGSVIDRTNVASIFDEDYQIVLTPFQRLRNVRTAKVCLPEGMVYDGNFAHNMETLLVERGAFGTWPDTEDPWDDKELEQVQDEMFLNLDSELDMLPGVTANMMRLERFSSWYTNGVGSESRYEKELERTLRTRTTYCENCNRLEELQ